MPMPDAERAVVAQEKVCGYLLDPDHPVGGTKAAWFAALGYSRGRWTDLADDLRLLAVRSADVVAVSSPYGVKYVTRGRIGRGGRSGPAVAVWIVEGNAPPRLVTAYPGDEG